MERFFSFANIPVALRTPDDWQADGESSLEPFAVDTVSDPHSFLFSYCDELDAPVGELIARQPTFWVYQENGTAVRYIGEMQSGWQGAYARVEHCNREHKVQINRRQYPIRITEKTILNCIAAEHLAVQAGGVVFHSSYIAHNGQAILFTAPSGTGKSTQADLWEKFRGAEIINGDRSVVRAVENGVFACGIPFAGSSQICKNKILPLNAIVYLKQAPATTIRRLRGSEAFRRVWEGCSVNTWDKQDMTLATETVMRVLESVPVFELACTPDESAVLALEGALKV